jgi:DNA polymerase III alpha subunit
MEDETGLIDVVAFPKAQTNNARSVWTSEVLTVEGQLHRQGKNGRSISIVMENVVPHLTGILADFLTLPGNESQHGR